jgi:hypothetical protein
VLRYRGWRYLLLTLVDMEANYMYITAYQFTTLTSIQVTMQAVSLIFFSQVRFSNERSAGCCYVPNMLYLPENIHSIDDLGLKMLI